MQPHHWPRRHFLRIADDIGVTIEPAGHNEQGEPLYEVYVSKTQETKTLTEAEVTRMVNSRLVSGYQLFLLPSTD